IEFPDKRRFVKKGFEYLSMATSGKLTLRSIPKPQCHECAFLIPVSEKRRSRSERRSLQNLLTYGPFFLHRTLQSG
ncbi:hypothetical protein ALC57_07064, partial [Trachymyrmex cornetzi]